MHQLINMYQPMFRRQPKFLSSTTLMIIIMIVMALLLGLYLKSHTTMKDLRRTSADLALDYSQLDAQLGVAASIAALPSNTSTSDEINLLQEQINDRKALLERIDNLFIDANAGFGEVFETLAQTNLPGLWLTGVQLDQEGGIEISGTTLDPKLVPRYLRLITQQSPLTTLTSGTVELKRDESDLSEINFVLSYNAFGDEP